MADVMPKERIDVMVKDTVVIFNSKPHKSRNKVLGAWKSSQRPWDDTKYMMSCTLLSYATQNPDFSGIPVDSDTSSKLEHRLYISLMPLRCFLTEEFIHFIKGIAEGQTAGNNNGTDLPSSRPPTEVNLYFQTIVMDQADMKINYKASAVNIGSLQNGDYLQLLNIFPIDGLELTLKSIRLNGVGDLNAAAGHIVETWVKDIYKNQLHKVIAGAAPLKGIAHISNDMHSLLFSGGSKIRGNNRQVIHHLQKGTKALATTIAKEALDVTHKLTMFVAQTITDLASDPEIEHGTASTKKPLKQPKNIGEGLHRAVDSVAREINGVAETVIAVPIRQYERSGTTGLLRSVVRALPVAVLRPIAGVTEGVSYTILGFRNHLDPTLKRDEEDMWDVGET
jgi:autophagy-related protein 2